ncbi:hypothetical protein GmHk_18G051877 [Glycine max]|nr:hypothetical protein GmHk_18G051877 [Glycine max]
MTSRKRKSIGTRPTSQYDTRRFSSLDAWTRYTNNVLGRSILPERKVELYHTELDDFRAELERRNFHKRLTNLVDGSIDLALSNTSRLEFPALITALCRARRVVSNSLTFECLSPVINLAYIRKNCWNPEDLTVSIKGARRARARPVELPSTFGAPILASTSATPSVPMVAPPDSIPLIEQFNEMVAWPGTQPSLHREDEGPTTQVPQLMEDESSEATIPEPFDIGEEAEETQVRQVAVVTPERSLEPTLEPSAPVVNLPSPQPTTDPSTPLLQMPEDLTMPVLAVDTSPPTTLVLQLTDEEDGQTQDTQDQS